jgi:hypothetical protein
MFDLPTGLDTTGSLLWLLAIAAAGFAVAWLLTDRLAMRRAPYVGVLAAVTAGLAAGYLAWSELGADFWTNRWGGGVLAAVLSGLVLAAALRRVSAPREDAAASFTAPRLLWESGVYGLAEGMLLSVLPVLVTWQALSAAGWSQGWRGLAAGIAAVLASIVVIVTHHLGYHGYRGRRLVQPIVGCVLLSIVFLLTGSPIAAMGGHVVLHAAMLRQGVEMPPHAALTSAGAHAGRRSHRPPRRAPRAPAAAGPASGSG